MSSGNQFERLFKLWATVTKLVIDGKRSAAKVADTLQSIVDEQLPSKLYLAPGQQNGGVMVGFDLEKHLQEEKLIERAYTLEDELVKSWLENPASYPEEFKNKAIFLWKSQRASGDYREVACLCWHGGRVVVHWRWLERRWDGYRPALLASS
ncbi:MAG: hypothetical protein UY54_C0014G0015 [Parcubacteria group bacterium GW2011_GWA2_50_10b]|nr:MAG: hypothetical protein UY54_C0014G0015 [Parcubacteria group bacterium GW2011_GWA2_50_10b]